MNKTDLRKEIKNKLARMDEKEYWQNSLKVKEQLVASREWEKAKTIGITISTGREIDTSKIIEEGWRQNKKIVVPKCDPKMKTMKFHQIHSFNEVEESHFSLKEPIVSLTPYVSKLAIDLLIVPGIVFDKRGYRIGYGGGYYDRFLIDFKKRSVSLAFQFQVVEEIPIEGHDMAVEKLIINT